MMAHKQKQLEDPSGSEEFKKEVLEYLGSKSKVLFGPFASLDSYKHGITLKIISPAFENKDQAERINELWPFFTKLPDSIMANLKKTELLTPLEWKD